MSKWLLIDMEGRTTRREGVRNPAYGPLHETKNYNLLVADVCAFPHTHIKDAGRGDQPFLYMRGLQTPDPSLFLSCTLEVTEHQENKKS